MNYLVNALLKWLAIALLSISLFILPWVFQRWTSIIWINKFPAILWIYATWIFSCTYKLFLGFELRCPIIMEINLTIALLNWLNNFFVSFYLFLSLWNLTLYIIISLSLWIGKLRFCKLLRISYQLRQLHFLMLITFYNDNFVWLNICHHVCRDCWSNWHCV